MNDRSISDFSHLSGLFHQGNPSPPARRDAPALQGCSFVLQRKSLADQGALVLPGHQEVPNDPGGLAERVLELRCLPSDPSLLGNLEVQADHYHRWLEVLAFREVPLNLEKVGGQSLRFSLELLLTKLLGLID